MTDAITLAPPESARANAVAETLSILLGAGFTLLLFIAVAHFAGTGDEPAEPDMVDLRAMAVPLEAPPPRPVETPVEQPAALPFAGLEIAAAESPVRIAVVPPDLAALLPVNSNAPAARIDPARLYTEFKPHTEIGGDFERIFQQYEVDQRPAIVSRPKPSVPGAVRGGADSLRIALLILVDTRGAVSNVRVLQGSGNKYFDAIIVRDVREAWVFSPAMKKGHRVRCLVQQNVVVKWNGASPFDAN
jgi:TonB family protein